MKKLSKILILTVIFCIMQPAFALKVKNPMIWGQKEPVRFVSIDDVLDFNVVYKHNLTPVYMPNLICHEFTRSYTLKSTTGQTYVRHRQRTVRITDKPSLYVKKLMKENEGNIYLAPQGYGLFGGLVGDVYIGDESLSKHLIEKGYCDYVQ